MSNNWLSFLVQPLKRTKKTMVSRISINLRKSLLPEGGVWRSAEMNKTMEARYQWKNISLAKVNRNGKIIYTSKCSKRSSCEEDKPVVTEYIEFTESVEN